jgi:mannose-6-phosphate isomerase
MPGRSEPAVSVRPWGTYQVIALGQDYQVKRIDVLPGKRLSYQTHRFRSEHWYVVAGLGTVTLDGRSARVEPGESVDIAVGVAHRIENVGEDLFVMIEVQRGSYLGEDDIVRIEDDFGRAAPAP